MAHGLPHGGGACRLRHDTTWRPRLFRGQAGSNAQAFAQNAAEAPRGYDENTSYTEDARDFADRAHEFHRTVEDPGADKADVRASFDDLSRSYHALRDDVQHSDSDYARRDLAPVTQAYLDVEDDMGGAEPSRYSDAE